MSLHLKLFGNGKSEIIDRYPRYEYLKQSSFDLDGEKLSVTIKNISLSGVLLEFLNRDREIVKKNVKKTDLTELPFLTGAFLFRKR